MKIELKNEVLRSLARLLIVNKQKIIKANENDLVMCSQDDFMVYDRLKLGEEKIFNMVKSIESVIKAEDSVGRLLYSYKHENGLRIENKTVAFGVILIIYEARPDVTIEAGIIAFKSGNKILLKGGKEAKQTNLCLVELWHQALREQGQSSDYISYLDISREEMQRFICDNKKIDLIIPRGGEALISFVKKHALAPVLVSGRGNNFLYVDDDSDFEMATKIILNGKQRLSVCNALDKVLINRSIRNIKEKLNSLMKALVENKIDVIGDNEVCVVNDNVILYDDESIWDEEFLSAKIMLSFVFDVDEAIEKINTHSGGHSASIITNAKHNAEKFFDKIDCAVVYHNASTRFTDGGEFGLGAEMAISTQKLHFRGPLGLNHLVTNKWFVYGDGQIRK